MDELDELVFRAREIQSRSSAESAAKSLDGELPESSSEVSDRADSTRDRPIEEALIERIDSPDVDRVCDFRDDDVRQICHATEIDPSDDFLDDLSSQLIQGDMLGRIEASRGNPTAACLTCPIFPEIERQTATPTRTDFLPTVRTYVNEDLPVIPQAQALLYEDSDINTAPITSDPMISEDVSEALVSDDGPEDVVRFNRTCANEPAGETALEPINQKSIETCSEISALSDGTVVYAETVTVSLGELTLGNDPGAA